MKLTVLGGGGFRVPLVHRALAGDPTALVDELWLHDLSAGRLAVVESVLAASGAPRPVVRCTTVLDEALAGADVVFSAIRVGGLEGRVRDERAALGLGLLGQETTGPGGVAYGLRTVPVALDIACAVRRNAPGALVVNFTNPAGMITEAMRAVLGDRVVGICDTPSGLVQRVAALRGVDPAALTPDYVGLNHLGWLRALTTADGRDLVAEVLADDAALAGLEEGPLFGAEWLRALGALPNEYLYYLYFTRDAVRSLLDAGETRGEFLLEQQEAFYARARRDPASAAALWHATRDEREATYMAEARAVGEARPDLSGGGYERVALDLMRAVVRDEPARLVLDVANGGCVEGLPADAVVEVLCDVDGRGARPAGRVAAPSLDQLGLMQQVKAVERLTIEAAVQRDRGLALKALALHPLVDSVTVARDLLAAYERAQPALFDA